ERTTATKILGYTQSDEPDSRQGVVRAEHVEETLSGMRFHLSAPNGRALVETGLLGRYNVSNLLAVAAVLIDAGMTPSEVAARFADLHGQLRRNCAARSAEVLFNLAGPRP
ncbi:MAG TPA: Mur ligase family protein, partial [Burkholderiaceae bacterium]|nr:Mur ligase family protein [Burkholderiaceae bacterium]